MVRALAHSVDVSSQVLSATLPMIISASLNLFLLEGDQQHSFPAGNRGNGVQTCCQNSSRFVPSGLKADVFTL